MNTQEILTTIQTLPLSEQCDLLAAIARNIKEQTNESLKESFEEFNVNNKAGNTGESQLTEEERKEAEVEQMLLAAGVISEVPDGIDDEDDDFEPIEVIGKPISETIIEERR